MAAMREIRLAVRTGRMEASRLTGTHLTVKQDDGCLFSLPITAPEYLRLRDKGPMEVVVNVRLRPIQKAK